MTTPIMRSIKSKLSSLEIKYLSYTDILSVLIGFSTAWIFFILLPFAINIQTFSFSDWQIWGSLILEVPLYIFWYKIRKTRKQFDKEKLT